MAGVPPTLNSAPDVSAEEKQLAYEVALSAVKEIEAGFVRTITATVGFYLIAIGWLITQPAAREFVASSRMARAVAFGAVVLVTGILCVLHLFNRRLGKTALALAETTGEALTATSFVAIARLYRISDVHVALAIVTTLVLGGGLLFLIALA